MIVRLTLAVAVAVVSSLLSLSGARASDSELVEAGRAWYRRYCASCHAASGKGDGPVAPALGQRPTDLTRLAAENGGRFPFLRTMAVIDGTRAPHAHGVSEMPVWGDVLHPVHGWSPDAVAMAQGKVVLITQYLQSLQER